MERPIRSEGSSRIVSGEEAAEKHRGDTAALDTTALEGV
jgi:hypothetical protein